MSQTRAVYCCGCVREVQARLTDGREIYPHRPDLADLPFWRCDTCRNYVGCHHKTADRTRPMGSIPTKEVSARRRRLHALFDQAWKSGEIGRRELYEAISKAIGHEYHAGEIRSVEEADRVLDAGVKALRVARNRAASTQRQETP